MKKHLPQKSNPANFQGNGRNKGKGKNSLSGNNSHGNSANKKKRNYCRKFHHRIEDCYTRKADKFPCYTTKGEPYHPKGDYEGNKRGNAGTFKPAAPLSTAKPQDFPHWV